MNNIKIVDPHYVDSKEATKSDIPRIKKDAKLMYDLCFEPHGLYPGGMAVAHPQITKKKPLRFFVTKENKIIVNPVITRHTKTTVDSPEGCLSFADKPQNMVQRWYKCVVEYYLLEDGELIKQIENVKGTTAFVFQHEIDHFDSKYVW